jgi:hypothetical protein
MLHLGANRLIDPALVSTPLAIRRGPIDEMNTSMSDDARIPPVRAAYRCCSI